MTDSSPFSKYLNALSLPTPTLIQSLCFSPLAEKKSVDALAPTGSGKTLAFILPLLLDVQCEHRALQKIILVPTRELGTQIAQLAQQVSTLISSLDNKNILVRTSFGGSPISSQIEELAKNPHVLIGTPGRVIDLLARKALDTKSLTTLILDEADVMVGMGFAEQILEIHEALPSHVQIGLFSATKNEKVNNLEELLFKNEEPLVCNAYESSLENKENTPRTADMSHKFINCQTDDKFKKLTLFLKQLQQTHDGKVILFCHRREGAQDLAESLKKQGFHADALTGELGQIHRTSVMRNFKSGSLKYLVATNIAARGIDTHELSAVIHYDIPFTTEDYIHRSGRTGRAGFTEGLSVAMCETKTHNYYVKLMQELKITPQEIILNNENRSAKVKASAKTDAIPLQVSHFFKLHLSKGKQHKIRPGDIVGAFIQELAFTKEDIGSIFIFSNFTHVEINFLKKEDVLDKTVQIKNLSVKITQAH